MGELKHLDGHGGAIEFDGGVIYLIAGKSLARSWGTNTLELPIADVVSIAFRRATPLANGRMTFKAVRTAGAYLPAGRSARGVVPDEALSVNWRRKDQAEFEALHEQLAALLVPSDARMTIGEKRAEDKSQARAEEQRLQRMNPMAQFGGAMVRGGRLERGLVKYELTGATAEATQGSPSSRSTFTRMGAGALLAGPVGFVVGAVAKKKTSKCYVTISLAEGIIVLEDSANNYSAAIRFADAVNRSKRE